MRFGLQKQVILEAVESKFQKTKSEELLEMKFSRFDIPKTAHIYFEDFGDIFYDLEKDTGGKIKLASPLPVITENDNPLSFSLGDIDPETGEVLNPNYYRVVYDPNVKGTSIEQSISFKKGVLEQTVNGKTYTYKPKRKRLEILQALTNDFTSTKDMADRVHLDQQTLRSQFQGIRQQIDKRLIGIRGIDLIRGEPISGYRFDKQVTLD